MFIDTFARDSGERYRIMENVSPRHDIIVIGASLGGVKALQTLVRALPDDLAASLFIVMHF